MNKLRSSESYRLSTRTKAAALLLAGTALFGCSTAPEQSPVIAPEMQTPTIPSADQPTVNNMPNTPTTVYGTYSPAPEIPTYNPSLPNTASTYPVPTTESWDPNGQNQYPTNTTNTTNPYHSDRDGDGRIDPQDPYDGNPYIDDRNNTWDPYDPDYDRDPYGYDE